MSPTDPEPARRTSILVVEDNGLQRQILRSALARHGYAVEAASDGLDAVRKVREGSYDLVLVDYQLPEFDGFAAARLIRELMGETACPMLLALTAWPDRLADRQAASGGAFDGIIAKPIRLADLISVIEACLASAPSSGTRRAGGNALLEKRWVDFDADPSRPAMENGQPRPPYILIVEDDDQQQFVLRTALEACEYKVETAPDGMKAVSMIGVGTYDLVLIDYLLPEIDGLAVGRLIRDFMNEDVRPRMIAITAVPGQLLGRQKDTGSAFDEVVAKSSGLPVLLAAIDRHLQTAPNPGTRRAIAAVRASVAERKALAR